MCTHTTKTGDKRFLFQSWFAYANQLFLLWYYFYMEPTEPIDINAPIPTPMPAITPHAEKDAHIAKYNSHIQPVRTFNSDLADAVREKGGSVVRIAIAENEKQQREYQEVSITSRKNMIFTIAGILIVAACIAGLVWTYSYKKSASIITPVTPAAPSSIVFSENSQTIDTSTMQSSDLITAINAIVAAPNIQSGTIKNIVIAQGTTRSPSSQFLTTIGATHAPADFLRSLSPEYMLGTYLYNQDSLFLIIRGTAHDFLLSGMLAWEPYILSDLAPLYAVDVTGANAKALDAKWSDTVIENHDARAVLDANKKPILFYSFLNENEIFISTDPKTLTAVVGRL